MIQGHFRLIGAFVLTAALSTLPVEKTAAADAGAFKPRIVVLTDIGADVDDQESLVRLLVV
jgi:hypothetical protein